MIKASVVVPVYNPGRYLRHCAESLLGQSLPPDEYEIVFVDDGSTDDSPERLDALAAAHPQVRVHHQENSGWPGRPRNVGVELARGEYVQFVDQDDELAPEALERMYTLGSDNDADIVLGKVGGTMTAPSNVFARTVASCTVADAPLIESVTPHKMFRRSFLLDNGIRFPEGRVRLEDQLFMARAYTRAKSVSIVGDYVCYRWIRRDDGGNNSGNALNLRAYYQNLRQVMDAVVEGTEPGEVRDLLLRRFLRVEMMGRLREPKLNRYSDGYRDAGYQEVRKLALERFREDDGVVGGLAPLMRLRATLLLRDRLDGLREIASRCEKVRAELSVEEVGWREGALRIRVRAVLVHSDGRPVVVTERAGRYHLDDVLTAGLPTLPDGWDVGDPCRDVQGELRVLHRDTGTWWFAPEPLRGSLERVEHDGPQPRYQVVASGEFSFDPDRLAGGGPLSAGRCELSVSVQILGLGRSVPVALDGSPHWEQSLVPALVGQPARIVVPRRTIPTGRLTIEVGDRDQALAVAVAALGVGPSHLGGSHLRLSLPIRTGPGAGAHEVEVVVGRAGRARTLPGRIEPAGAAVLALEDVPALPAGRHPIALRTESSGRRPAVPIGVAVVREGRIVAVHGVGHRALPRRLLARVAGDRRLRRPVYQLVGKLPDEQAELAKKVIRRVARWSRTG
ncbi:Glycosyltransferase involved in cell wall bisynthesis [Actinopolymorpha cephalotaxi]|uniref:Glycosyltransferase involved in cell wall biosynthesis n=1 Tax=Actinopolymorpha cephalotaxi TaxID=504797 RepID=A0A1I2R7J2_9ACTN|nr:glycosyltransferase family A protein [Actinopolymorpha cephalotaxi]NYH82387.1 glycosyltransferase involved in cell wall biosynthesis [Actinopolymorpha cephalotaxi]SFG34567.1 Glycosyltransferase involved in cell wall bisynthesis [Actinopolymorpha cephalotaxi]